jgi:hypothetical protein
MELRSLGIIERPYLKKKKKIAKKGGVGGDGQWVGVGGREHTQSLSLQRHSIGGCSQSSG